MPVGSEAELVAKLLCGATCGGYRGVLCRGVLFQRGRR